MPSLVDACDWPLRASFKRADQSAALGWARFHIGRPRKSVLLLRALSTEPLRPVKVRDQHHPTTTTTTSSSATLSPPALPLPFFSRCAALHCASTRSFALTSSFCSSAVAACPFLHRVSSAGPTSPNTSRSHAWRPHAMRSPRHHNQHPQPSDCLQ